MSAPAEKYLTACALAKALGISRATLYRAIQAGTIVGHTLYDGGHRLYLLSEARAAFRAAPYMSEDLHRACERAAKRAVARAAQGMT